MIFLGSTVTAGIERMHEHRSTLESFQLIDQELGPHSFLPEQYEIVRRVIHATADFDFAEVLRFTPGAVVQGIRALQAGANVIADSGMVAAGLRRSELLGLGGQVHCFSDEDLPGATLVQRGGKQGATERLLTRSAAAMRKSLPILAGAVVAVGGAPTALRELLAMLATGAPSPALVVGVPVSLVDAADAKQMLLSSGWPCIATVGPKGGPAAAAAIVNALVRLSQPQAGSGPVSGSGGTPA